MLVYALCRERNERAGRPVIPETVLDKPPSAELRARPARLRLAARLRAARPDHRGLRRGRPLDRRARGRGPRPRHRAADRPHDRPQRVQAPPGPAGGPGVAQGVRQGPAAARSRTAGPASAPPWPDGATPPRGRSSSRHSSSGSRSRSSTTRSTTSRRSRTSCSASRSPSSRWRPSPSTCSDPVATIGGSSCGWASSPACCSSPATRSQTVGLQYTSPSTSAFITGLYVVMTPVVESLVRRRTPPLSVCTGIVVATGRPVPAHRRRPRRRQGRAADARVRGDVRGVDRLPGRVRRTGCIRSRSRASRWRSS